MNKIKINSPYIKGNIASITAYENPRCMQTLQKFFAREDVIDYLNRGDFAYIYRLWNSTSEYAGSVLTTILLESEVDFLTNTSLIYKGSFTYLDIESVVLPDTTREIAAEAFYDCRFLQSVVLNPGLTTIGFAAFWGCSSLQSIVLPDGFLNIHDRAFQDCSDLTQISLPSTLTSVGMLAFDNDEQLQRVTFRGTAKQFSKIQGISASACFIPHNAIIECTDETFLFGSRYY